MGLILPGDRRSVACYDGELAGKLGVTAAIVLSRIIWSLEKKMEVNDLDFFIDGRWWMYDTIPALMEYSQLGRHQILLALKTLKEKNILIAGQHDHKFGVRRNWFSVDKAVLLSIVRKPDDSSLWLQNRTIDSPETGRYLLITKSHTESPNLSIEDKTDPIVTKPDDRNVVPMKRKPRTKKPKPQIPPQFLELGTKWLEFAKRKSKSGRSNWTAQSFAEHLEKTSTTAEVTIEQLAKALTYLEGDVFWTQYAHSPKTLLVVSKTQDKYRIVQILEAMTEGGRNERGRKGIDLSADNGKFANYVDDYRPNCQTWSEG